MVSFSPLSPLVHLKGSTPPSMVNPFVSYLIPALPEISWSTFCSIRTVAPKSVSERLAPNGNSPLSSAVPSNSSTRLFLTSTVPDAVISIVESPPPSSVLGDLILTVREPVIDSMSPSVMIAVPYEPLPRMNWPFSSGNGISSHNAIVPSALSVPSSLL